MYYKLLAASILAVLAGCGDRGLPDLSSLPNQGGSLIAPSNQDSNDTTYTAQTTGAGSTSTDTNQANTTTGSPNATNSTTTATTGGTTTNGTTTATTGGTTTNGTTTATTGGTTTSGTTTTAGGTTTGGSTTSTGAATIPSTTGGPGTNTYNSAQTNAISGTVNGVSISVASALFHDSSQSGQATLVVVLSDQANLCTTLTNGGRPQNSHQVRIIFFAGSAAWPPDGSYATEGGPPTSTATFSFYDGSGNQTLGSDHASLHTGQVQLSDYGHGAQGDAQGSAQGLVGSQIQTDTVSLTFNASYCAAVQ
jgi:hypothetical protein